MKADLIEMPVENLRFFSTPEYRKLFQAGRKFKVLQTSTLVGMQPHSPNCEVGWKRVLQPGDIITCKGESMTYGDGVPAAKWAGADGEHLANDCTFLHTEVLGGLYAGQCPGVGRVVPLYEEGEEIPEPPRTTAQHMECLLSVVEDYLLNNSDPSVEESLAKIDALVKEGKEIRLNG